MFKDLKEDMNKYLHEDWENIQGVKVEIGSLRKIQTEIQLEMKTLGCEIKASVTSLTSRLRDMGERISGLEDGWKEWVAQSETTVNPPPVPTHGPAGILVWSWGMGGGTWQQMS